MNSTFPLSRDLVLVGGGHTHALVLKMWAMAPLPGVRLTVINPAPIAPYSGMLPGFIAGHYAALDLYIDLIRLARAAGATLITGKVTQIDTDAKLVQVPGRAPIGYDVLSVDIGITSAMPDLKGFAEHAVPAKPLDTFAASWEAYCSGRGPANVAVIGAGVAGAEVAMAAAHRLKTIDRPANIYLIDRSKALSRLGLRARRKTLQSLHSLNVNLLEDSAITEITHTHILIEGGPPIEVNFALGAAGTRPYDWLMHTGLALERGYIAVNPNLQSTSHPDIFAVGDCAHMLHAPRPKAGVFAVRQAPVLAHNLRAALMERGTLREYHPQSDYLKLISLGDRSALAEKLGLTLSGPAMWQWKDRIDRKFMDQFSDLAPMASELPKEHAAQTAPAGQMLCAGCGSKVGRDVLRTITPGKHGMLRKDATLLPGDDAALLTMGDVQQVLSTDHLRAFTDDLSLMTTIAANHALGDIWSMGAHPQSAMISITLPRMEKALQERSLAQIMQAADEVFELAGAQIIGGHTTMGAETVLGFSLTGLLERAPLTLAGAKPGDVLVLTKPIGTGVILAAEMQMRAKGEHVQAAYDVMCISSQNDARLLSKAHAMTDVTGFGLAGHLANLCRSSQLDAELDLAQVPTLPGAMRLSDAGIRSSLYPDNLSDILPLMPEHSCAKGRLLLDPQTAGGLLAAIAPDIWNGLPETQRSHMAVIGRMREAESPSTPRIHLMQD